jgi:hypothetical protein
MCERVPESPTAQMRGAIAEIVQVFGQNLFRRNNIVHDFVGATVGGIKRVRQSDPVKCVGEDGIH